MEAVIDRLLLGPEASVPGAAGQGAGTGGGAGAADEDGDLGADGMEESAAAKAHPLRYARLAARSSLWVYKLGLSSSLPSLLLNGIFFGPDKVTCLAFSLSQPSTDVSPCQSVVPCAGGLIESRRAECVVFPFAMPLLSVDCVRRTLRWGSRCKRA